MRYYLQCQDECLAAKALWLATSCRLLRRQMEAATSPLSRKVVDFECEPEQLPTVRESLRREGFQDPIEIYPIPHDTHKLPDPETTRKRMLVLLYEYYGNPHLTTSSDPGKWFRHIVAA